MSGLGLVSHDLQVFGRLGSGDGFQMSHFAGPYEAVIQRKPMLRNRRVLQRDSCEGRLLSGVVLARVCQVVVGCWNQPSWNPPTERRSREGNGV